MRIHELVPEAGQCVIHNGVSEHTMVLTAQGAVFNNEQTDDLRNMSVAFGLLATSDAWRLATDLEILAHRDKPNTHMMRLEWAKPPARVRPKFTVVKKD